MWKKPFSVLMINQKLLMMQLFQKYFILVSTLLLILFKRPENFMSIYSLIQSQSRLLTSEIIILRRLVILKLELIKSLLLQNGNTHWWPQDDSILLQSITKAILIMITWKHGKMFGSFVVSITHGYSISMRTLLKKRFQIRLLIIVGLIGVWIQNSFQTNVGKDNLYFNRSWHKNHLIQIIWFKRFKNFCRSRVVNKKFY